LRSCVAGHPPRERGLARYLPRRYCALTFREPAPRPRRERLGRRRASLSSIAPTQGGTARGRHRQPVSLTIRPAVMRDRKMVVADVPVPEPGPGEVLVRTLACGICGSDLHALKYADAFVETSRRAGNPRVMDLGRDVVMGHEFCAEIVDHGP